VSGHPDLRALIDGLDLKQAERRELLAHLEGCAACRARIAAADPSLLFSVLALEPVPSDVLAQVSRRAATAISVERQRSARRRGRLWRGAAASILVAGLAGAYFWISSNRPGPPSDVPPMVQAATPEAAAGAIPAGMIELLESPGASAEVVALEVGDVDIVMIFDEAMGI
jgi:anti-sigma factor RsiW